MPDESRTDWTWVENTYWYVLPPDLPALQLDPDENALSWLVDQTVWHITGYKNGYLWGVTAAVMREPGQEMPSRGPGSRPSQLTLMGTVTPSGQVQLTFVPGRGSSSATIGFGQMVQRRGEWVFEMQMSTDRRGARVLHWANMVQTRPGEASWDRLPGVERSVPEMLEGAVYPTFQGE